jgi:hypothetical protein
MHEGTLTATAVWAAGPAGTSRNGGEAEGDRADQQETAETPQRPSIRSMGA